MSKTVKIKRHYNFVESVQNDPVVKEWFDNSYKAIGPCWDRKTKSTMTGMTWDEICVVMPDVVNVPSDHKDFRREVSNYFDELLLEVPADGIDLEIGLANDNRPLSADNLPLNVKDYIQWRRIKNNPGVAKDEGEAEALTVFKHFYIHDVHATKRAEIALTSLEDKATEVYFQVKGDKLKVDQILTLMGMKTERLTEEDKLLHLKRLSKPDHKKEADLQIKALNDFINVATSEDIELEYMVTMLIAGQVLERVGPTITVAETGELIGDNMKEAIVFLKNPKNSKTVTFLKNYYNQMFKKNEPKKAPAKKTTKKKTETNEA